MKGNFNMKISHWEAIREVLSPGLLCLMFTRVYTHANTLTCKYLVRPAHSFAQQWLLTIHHKCVFKRQHGDYHWNSADVTQPPVLGKKIIDLDHVTKGLPYTAVKSSHWSVSQGGISVQIDVLRGKRARCRKVLSLSKKGKTGRWRWRGMCV